MSNKDLNSNKDWWQREQEELKAKLAEARNAALEEAAKLIEEDYCRAARAIRALKGEPK